MIVNIIVWILFGALAGWIASIIAGTNREQGAIANILVGIAGAIIGGYILRFFTGDDQIDGFNLGSLLTAILGAVILLFVIKLFTGNHREV